ncbi:hypothetical protein Vadar_011018 [Vaccinium darrowii]|uniref:Uncharacterized protein n=1 Tax=Vaccinium darrowii TaxID=229202 RepID=A0ACB7WZJ5_9ERIC|nr:hypothetical protein Vadar_011018 [Vaccinium darrowii]
MWECNLVVWEHGYQGEELANGKGSNHDRSICGYACAGGPSGGGGRIVRLRFGRRRGQQKPNAKTKIGSYHVDSSGRCNFFVPISFFFMGDGGGGGEEKNEIGINKLQKSYFDGLGLCCSSEVPLIEKGLELGIVVHSVIIGLALGASESPSTIRPLVAALSFHQSFEAAWDLVDALPR